MAKNNAKEPGQITQIIMVLRRTIELDRRNLWIIFLPVLGAAAIGVTIAVISFGSGNWLSGILTSITTLLGMFLVFSLLLTRRAESAAYASWEGQMGAVGAVIQTMLRGKWRGSEQPIAVNPRGMDALYRIVGTPGIVLIGEGHQSGSQLLADNERKRLAKVAPGVPIHTVFVTESERAVKLSELRKTLGKFDKKLNRNEIKTVASRLTALGINLPIPKGIDPRRARPVRK